MIAPAQCRAARALLDWTQRKLAEESSISLRSVQGFEAGEHALRSAALVMIERIFQEKGIVFVSDPDWIGAKIEASRLSNR